jgi:hypothetical protein
VRRPAAITLWRGLFMLVGVVIGAVGAWKLLQAGFDNLVPTVETLVVGVVLHDGVLAPATIVLTALAVRLAPTWMRGPATLGLIVLGSATLLAIPVLGRFGARSDNPTLLDRNYWAGWCILATLVLIWVAALALRRRAALASNGSQGADGGDE